VKVLISGGCGLIGRNTVARFSEIGHQVTLYDNLSRVGADSNLDSLRHHREVEFIHGDVRSLGTLCDLLQARHFDVVIHLVAQVAVTTSITDPEHDLEVNARGTSSFIETPYSSPWPLTKRASALWCSKPWPAASRL
jgi:CDP-paratose 2-epimerase